MTDEEREQVVELLRCAADRGGLSVYHERCAEAEALLRTGWTP